MPQGDWPAVLVYCLASTAVVIAIFAWIGHGVIGEVHDNYTCEAVDGYNPSGATTAERYPPGTWAGLCEKNESGAVTLYGVLLGLGAVVLWVVCATIAREVNTHVL